MLVTFSSSSHNSKQLFLITITISMGISTFPPFSSISSSSLESSKFSITPLSPSPIFSPTNNFACESGECFVV